MSYFDDNEDRIIYGNPNRNPRKTMSQQYQQKDNSGALFKNDTKEGNQPDYKGQATIEGMDFWMSAWVKEASTGRKYMSFSFQPKTAAPAQRQQPQRPQSKPALKYGTSFDSVDDDIPW